LILTEAAVVERLRRGGKVELHPRLVHAALIYDETGRRELKNIFQSYIDVARRAHLPLILCAPTWRANRDRVFESGVSSDINQDAVEFMGSLRPVGEAADAPVKIGGLIGCKNDCYMPEEALSADEAEEFHSWQLKRLADGGVDFLIAETLPDTQEALGIARAMAAAGLPYIISFVINRMGFVLDGTPLAEAADFVDRALSDKPLGFMVNCAHPTFLNVQKQPKSLFDKLIGYQANASSLDHVELDSAGQLKVDEVSEWGDKMLTLHRRYGVKILGGCCGTSVEHLEYLVTHY
jgi:S-methylmethionine-dependent homocysteine/selenocysteine methylase